MGYNATTWCFWSKFLDFEKNRGKKVIELGNQMIKRSLAKILGINECQSREYFGKMGLKCTTLDILGGNNVIAMDLSVKIKSENLLNQFDILTNAGTTEHVEPFENQMICFNNIHNFVKKDGIMLHSVPAVGSYKNHCSIYYTTEFFEELAKSNNYEIVYLDKKYTGIAKHLIFACLKKTSDDNFVKDEKTFTECLIYHRSKKKKARDKVVRKLQFELQQRGK